MDDSPSPVAGSAELETEHPAEPAAGTATAWLADATAHLPAVVDCPNVEIPGMGDLVVFNDPDNSGWRVYDGSPGRRVRASEVFVDFSRAVQVEAVCQMKAWLRQRHEERHLPTHNGFVDVWLTEVRFTTACGRELWAIYARCDNPWMRVVWSGPVPELV